MTGPQSIFMDFAKLSRGSDTLSGRIDELLDFAHNNTLTLPNTMVGGECADVNEFSTLVTPAGALATIPGGLGLEDPSLPDHIFGDPTSDRPSGAPEHELHLIPENIADAIQGSTGERLGEGYCMFRAAAWTASDDLAPVWIIKAELNCKMGNLLSLDVNGRIVSTQYCDTPIFLGYCTDGMEAAVSTTISAFYGLYSDADKSATDGDEA